MNETQQHGSDLLATIPLFDDWKLYGKSMSVLVAVGKPLNGLGGGLQRNYPGAKAGGAVSRATTDGAAQLDTGFLTGDVLLGRMDKDAKVVEHLQRAERSNARAEVVPHVETWKVGKDIHLVPGPRQGRELTGLVFRGSSIGVSGLNDHYFLPFETLLIAHHRQPNPPINSTLVADPHGAGVSAGIHAIMRVSDWPLVFCSAVPQTQTPQQAALFERAGRAVLLNFARSGGDLTGFGGAYFGEGQASALSAHVFGPLRHGAPKHKIGSTASGDARSAAIDLLAYFGDGTDAQTAPLDFEYADHPIAGSGRFVKQVHLRIDRRRKHAHLCGEKDFLWRWHTRVDHYTVPTVPPPSDDPPEIPPYDQPPDVPPPPPPEIPPDGPPGDPPGTPGIDGPPGPDPNAPKRPGPITHEPKDRSGGSSQSGPDAKPRVGTVDETEGASDYGKSPPDANDGGPGEDPQGWTDPEPTPPSQSTDPERETSPGGRGNFALDDVQADYGYSFETWLRAPLVSHRFFLGEFDNTTPNASRDPLVRWAHKLTKLAEIEKRADGQLAVKQTATGAGSAIYSVPELRKSHHYTDQKDFWPDLFSSGVTLLVAAGKNTAGDTLDGTLGLGLRWYTTRKIASGAEFSLSFAGEGGSALPDVELTQKDAMGQQAVLSRAAFRCNFDLHVSSELSFGTSVDITAGDDVDIAGASVVRITVAAVSLTGLVAPAWSRQRFILINNRSGVSATIAHEDGASDAQNRFSCPSGAAYTIAAGGGCVAHYDTTIGRWVIDDLAAGAGSGDVTAPTGPFTRDNAATRVDTGGTKQIQESELIIDDASGGRLLVHTENNGAGDSNTLRIDSGTATGTAGNVELGNANAPTVQLGRASGCVVSAPAPVTLSNMLRCNAVYSGAAGNDVAIGAVVKVRITSGASLTGMVPANGGTAVDGQLVVVENATGATLTINSDSGLSLAANRFFTAGDLDVTIPVHGAIGAVYSTTDSRWRVFSLASGGGSLSATQVEVDLGTPKTQGKFTITDASIVPTSKIDCWQAPGPYTGKGVSTDEGAAQPVMVTSVVAGTGSAVVYWQTPPIVGYARQTQEGRVNVLGATYDRLSNQRWPDGFVAVRSGKIRGNVKFYYTILS